MGLNIHYFHVSYIIQLKYYSHISERNMILRQKECYDPITLYITYISCIISYNNYYMIIVYSFPILSFNISYFHCSQCPLCWQTDCCGNCQWCRPIIIMHICTYTCVCVFFSSGMEWSGVGGSTVDWGGVCRRTTTLD